MCDSMYLLGLHTSVNEGLSPLKNRVWSELTEKQLCESSKEQSMTISEEIPKGRVGNYIVGSGQWINYMKELILEFS